MIGKPVVFTALLNGNTSLRNGIYMVWPTTILKIMPYLSRMLQALNLQETDFRLYLYIIINQIFMDNDRIIKLNGLYKKYPIGNGEFTAL